MSISSHGIAVTAPLDMVLETAIKSALSCDSRLSGVLNGIYDERPVQASAPYLRLGEMIASDWSAKGFDGREILLSLFIHDRARERLRAAEIARRVEEIIAALPSDISGGRIVLVRLQRLKAGRDGETSWALVMNWRFLLERI